ncbi:MAG: T9SS type A sorting domain-containing protein [Ekhidna sp.]|nr:T9SS type A sorting domain-containing protein [Ekhidna sp.]
MNRSRNVCRVSSPTITLNLLAKPERPIITVDAGTLTGCEGDGPVTLSAPEGFAYYEWSNGVNAQSITVDPAVSSTDYTVRVSNSADNEVACLSDLSQIVTVTRQPISEFSARTSSSLSLGTSVVDGLVLDDCDDDFTIFFFDGDSYTNGGTVEIVKDGEVVNTTTSRSVALNESGDYSFNWLNIGRNSCSISTGTFTLNLLEQPDRPAVAVTTGTLEGCVGDGPVTLRAPAGFAYYEWSNGINTRIITVDPDETTSYSVVVSNSTDNEVACLSPESDLITVTREFIDDFNIRSSASLTTGTAITDGMTIEGCDAGYTVYFFNDDAYSNNGTVEIVRNGAVINTTNSRFVTLDQSGDYSFNWTNSNRSSCSVSSGTFTLNLAATPAAPSISTTDALSFCEGQGSVTISGPAGFAQYKWFKNGSVISSNSDGGSSTNSSITVTDGGIYALEVSNIADQDACFSLPSNSIEVSSRAVASDAVGINQIGIICQSGTSLVEITGTQDRFNYQLINYETGLSVGQSIRGASGGDPLRFTTESLTIDTEYYIQVSYADGEGCPAQEVANQFTVQVNNFTLDLIGNTIVANVYGNGDVRNIEWFRNGVRLRNKTGDSELTITDAATYTAQLDFGGGCVITTDAIQIESGARMSTNFDDLVVTSFPNPSTDLVTVSLNDGPLGSYSLSVISLSGKVVISQNINKVEDEHEEVVDLSGLENGVYTLTVRRGNNVESVRVIKQ